HTGTRGPPLPPPRRRSAPSLIGRGSNATANVGNAGRLTNIRAAVTITNPPSFTAVNVDDSADPDPRIVVLDTASVNGADHGRISFGGVPILYKYADTASVSVRTGQNDDVVNVLG